MKLHTGDTVFNEPIGVKTMEPEQRVLEKKRKSYGEKGEKVMRKT